MEKRGHPRFYELVDEMVKIHTAKNHDYAGIKDPLANLEACEEIGIEPWIGCFIRLMDKFDRIKNFVQQKELKVKSETIKDTFMDIAVYALLDYILYEESHGEMPDKTLAAENLKNNKEETVSEDSGVKEYE